MGPSCPSMNTLPSEVSMVLCRWSDDLRRGDWFEVASLSGNRFAFVKRSQQQCLNTEVADKQVV